MKRNFLLLIDADADTASAVMEAAAETHLDLRFARTSKDAFHLFDGGLDDVAVVVLDVDPGVHGMAVLEALDAWDPAPPVIVISSLEEAHLAPVTRAHGAQECFGKPVSIERLKTAIAKLARPPEARVHQCDRWDHPCKDCSERDGATPEREYAFFVEEY
ncbi:MAG TPA: response regulator [Chthoniobacterales bacterium]|nr:response regulator [Chthoniobacterales bacterium]